MNELKQMIAGVLKAYPPGHERIKALKACQWRLRGPCGEFVGIGDVRSGFKGKFLPESHAQLFDGRDNEDLKFAVYQRDLGPLTVEIIPQIP